MKKEKKGRLLCLLCLILALVPLLGMLVFGPSAALSNERPAAKPQLFRGGQVNWNVLTETADYLASHFYLRPQLLTANSAVQAAVFGESASGDVVLGKDGWLFYAETLADFQGTNPMSAREIFCAAKNLALLREYCEESGTRFLFVCAPNKNTIYPEFMPDQYRKTEAVSDLDRLEAALDSAGVSYCDVRGTLTGREALTYYKTDSHWNGYGSHLAAAEILNALGKKRASEEALAAKTHPGDLYGMLYPASSKVEAAPALERARSFSYASEVRGPDDQFIETRSNEDGTLFVFRDSFGNALHEDLAEGFGKAAFSRAMPYDASLIETMPDVLIAEIAQRNLRWLAQRPPLFPAPERTAPENLAEASETVLVKVSRSKLDGLSCYEGSFSFGLSDDARVCFFVDGTWFEAGLTENGFRLLAPAGESFRLAVETNGNWMEVDVKTAG